LCNDDQETGRQHPNIIKSLKLNLRMRILKDNFFMLSTKYTIHVIYTANLV